MARHLSFIVVLLLLCSLSCSSNKGGNNAPQPTPAPKDGASSSPPVGSFSLKINPGDGTRGTTFFAVAQGFSVGDAKMEWLVNGAPVPAPAPDQFRATEARKGDKIQVRATLNGKELLSDVITIKNSAPEIADAKIVVESGSAVSAEATTRDADGDTVALQYEWTVNRAPSGSERQLKRSFKQGDDVTVTITPYDGESYGRPVVLQKIFGNMPPVVRDSRTTSFDGKTFTYQISASDPDGDRLTYSLKSGPQGMTVDASTGLVRWEVPKDFIGKAPATVVVSDGHGGETLYQFNAIIRLER